MVGEADAGGRRRTQPPSEAQAITVGPDPDSVAPPQPAGGVVRIAASVSDGR